MKNFIFPNRIPIRTAVKMYLFLLCGLISSGVYAQTPGDDSEPDTSGYAGAFRPEMLLKDCRYPTVSSKAVIFYQGFAAAYVQINGNGVSLNNLKYTATQDGRQNDFPINSGDGNIALNSLPLNTFYQIKGKNSCGEPVILAEFSTYPFKSGSDHIDVSDAFFKRLSQYVGQEGQRTPIHQYVAALDNVSIPEKTAFLQRFILAGTLLPNTTIGTFPTAIFDQGAADRGKGDETCMCEFVLNQSAFAIPDKVSQNSTIDPTNSSASGPFNDASKWWMNSTVKGPAKYHHLFSDGWKAGGSTFQKTWEFASSSQSSNASPYYAKISYHLLCVNFPAATPEPCQCTKQANTNFGYKTTIDTYAKLKPGTFTRKAWASGQDYAVAFITRNNVNSLNDVHILVAGLATAQSSCEGGVAAGDLIKSAGDIVGGVVEIIKSVKTAQLENLGSQISGLTTSIAGVLDKFENNGNCELVTTEAELLNGSSNITVFPNDPVSLVLLSGSKLIAGGKRSWDSNASVRSAFHLSGVLLGSNAAEGTSFCCTDYSAQWVYGSMIPNHISNLQIQVNHNIFQNFPNNAPLFINDIPAIPGHINAATEIGYARAVYSGCERSIPIFNFR